MGLWDSYRTTPQQVNPPTVQLNQPPEWLLEEIQSRLRPAERTNSTATGSRDSNDLLNEVLEIVRSQQKLLNSPEKLFPLEYARHVLLRREAYIGLSFDHPAFRDLAGNWVRIIDLLENVDSGDPAVLGMLFRELESLGPIIKYVCRRSLRPAQYRQFFEGMERLPLHIEESEAMEGATTEDEAG